MSRTLQLIALALTLAQGDSSPGSKLVSLDRVSARNAHAPLFPGSRYTNGNDPKADHKAAALAFDHDAQDPKRHKSEHGGGQGARMFTENESLESAIDAFGAAARFAPSVAANWNNLAVALTGREGTYDWTYKFDAAQKHHTNVAALAAYQNVVVLKPAQSGLTAEMLAAFYTVHDPPKAQTAGLVSKLLQQYSTAQVVESCLKKYGASPLQDEVAQEVDRLSRAVWDADSQAAQVRGTLTTLQH
jgi:hypothetical protein